MVADAKSEYGSFRDSLRAPIHRWFAYPAGYSYKFVDAKMRQYGLNGGSTIADPFLGTGTTSVVAKMNGVNSVGHRSAQLRTLGRADQNVPQSRLDEPFRIRPRRHSRAPTR